MLLINDSMTLVFSLLYLSDHTIVPPSTLPRILGLLCKNIVLNLSTTFPFSMYWSWRHCDVGKRRSRETRKRVILQLTIYFQAKYASIRLGPPSQSFIPRKNFSSTKIFPKQCSPQDGPCGLELVDILQLPYCFLQQRLNIKYTTELYSCPLLL